MSHEIPPALTPKQWRAFSRDGDVIDEWFCSPQSEARGRIGPDRAFYVMALANAALPDDDPRKLTRDTWYALDQVVRGQWPTEKMREDAERVVQILAALLPPNK